jgi:hypothetical protein
MYTHPELGLRLAQVKIEEARSRAQLASAVRAASAARRVSAVTAGTRRDRTVALVLAAVGRSRVRRRSLPASARGRRKAELMHVAARTLFRLPRARGFRGDADRRRDAVDHGRGLRR